LFFELFINEIFEKTFVIFIFDQSLWLFTLGVATLMYQKSFQRKMMCRKSCFAFLQEIAKLCQYNIRWRRQNKHFLEVCKKNYSENNQISF
jgi:hypothetical protein